MRADQINHMEGKKAPYWFAPIVADAEAGFGGILNSFELMKAMIEAGAAAVHLEDQLASAKKCGHLGGKVIIPTSEAVKKLVAARLAADICGVPTILIGRTDANSATLLANDIDERDRPFITGKRTVEGFYTVRNGIESAIERALAYAPYADMLWCEASEPDLAEAGRFAEAVHVSYPGKLLAYNLSPSFNWSAKLDKSALAEFQNKLASYGYRFQFVTLAGFHSINLGMYELARDFREKGMSAYSRFQDNEFELEKLGYKAVKHQSFVGTGYFDAVAQASSGEEFSTGALKGSTEEKQLRTVAGRREPGHQNRLAGRHTPSTTSTGVHQRQSRARPGRHVLMGVHPSRYAPSAVVHVRPLFKNYCGMIFSRGLVRTLVIRGLMSLCFPVSGRGRF